MEQEKSTRSRLYLPNSLTWFAFLFLGVSVVPPPTVGQKAPAGLTMHRQQAGTPNAKGWYDAKSTEGHFSVSLPIPFNDFTVKVKEKDGTEVVSYVIGSTSKEGFKFSATEMLNGRRTREFDAHAYVEKFKADKRNTVSNETLFEVDGHSAIQFHVSNAQQSAFMRALVVPPGVLLLIVEYPKRLERDVISLVKHFFDSLKIEQIM